MYDCFKLIYAYLNEGDKVCEYYSCLKMIVQAHLDVGFSTIFFIKRASLKRIYLYMKLLQSSTIFKQKNYHEVSYDQNFCMKFFTTPNSKDIIATLRKVTIEKSKLTFLLILYFHVYTICDEFFTAHWHFSKLYFFKHGNLIAVALSNSLYLVIG